MLGMDWIIHVANILFLLSYSVRDILALRVLTVVASLGLVPYYFANNLTTPIYWNVLFVSINLFQIYLLLLERRPVRLRDEEQQLYNMAFRSLSPRDFVRLIGLAQWKELPHGRRFVTAGETVDQLSILYSGGASVDVEGEQVATLNPGQFVGEMAYLCGQTSAANVQAAGSTRLVAWSSDQLRKFLAGKLELRAAVQNIMGTDLVGKLRGKPAQQ
jgi:hypothetical protein